MENRYTANLLGLLEVGKSAALKAGKYLTQKLGSAHIAYKEQYLQAISRFRGSLCKINGPLWEGSKNSSVGLRGRWKPVEGNA